MTDTHEVEHNGTQSIDESKIALAIETLSVELPHLFETDLSYDIYSKNIYFKDPVNTFKGKFNYRIIFWTLRFHGKLFFSSLYFDLHEIGQTADDEIVAHWTVHGTLRVPWKAGVLFNGYSTYKLAPDGSIYEHIDTWDRSPGEVLRQFFRKGTSQKEPETNNL